MALSPLKEEALDHGVSGIGLSENQSHLESLTYSYSEQHIKIPSILFK